MTVSNVAVELPADDADQTAQGGFVGHVAAGRLADCTIRTPGMAMICRVIRSTAISPAGLRMSWSAETVTTVGNRWFVGKCRSAAS